MKPILAAPLVAIVLAGAGVGTYFAVASEGKGEEAAVAETTPTPEAEAVTAITPTTAPTPEPSPTVATPVETAAPTPASPQSDQWIVYVDPELGFSFPYRSDWGISIDYYDLPAKKGNPAVRLRSVTFHNAEGAQTIALGVTPNPADLTLEDWVASYPGWPSEPESVTVAGQTALLFPINQMGEQFPVICFKYGGFVVSMSGNIYGSKGGALPPGISEADFQRVIDGFTFGP